MARDIASTDHKPYPLIFNIGSSPVHMVIPRSILLSLLLLPFCSPDALRVLLHRATRAQRCQASTQLPHPQLAIDLEVTFPVKLVTMIIDWLISDLPHDS